MDLYRKNERGRYDLVPEEELEVLLKKRAIDRFAAAVANEAISGSFDVEDREAAEQELKAARKNLDRWVG